MKSYIRGIKANAACSLIDELSAAGIVAEVGYVTHGTFRELLVYVGDPKNLPRVPSEWFGVPVKARVMTR